MNASEATLIKRLREVAGPIDHKILDEVFEYEQTADREWGCCHTAAEIEAGECDASSEIGIVTLLGQRYFPTHGLAQPELVGVSPDLRRRIEDLLRVPITDPASRGKTVDALVFAVTLAIERNRREASQEGLTAGFRNGFHAGKVEPVPEQLGEQDVIAEGAFGDQPQTVPVRKGYGGATLPLGDSCPECRVGKHGNCTEAVPLEVPEVDGLRWVQCPCLAKGHH